MSVAAPYRPSGPGGAIIRETDVEQQPLDPVADAPIIAKIAQEKLDAQQGFLGSIGQAFMPILAPAATLAGIASTVFPPLMPVAGALGVATKLAGAAIDQPDFYPTPTISPDISTSPNQVSPFPTYSMPAPAMPAQYNGPAAPNGQGAAPVRVTDKVLRALFARYPQPGRGRKVTFAQFRKAYQQWAASQSPR